MATQTYIHFFRERLKGQDLADAVAVGASHAANSYDED